MTREKIVKDMSLQDAIQVLRDTNAFGTMDIAKSVILKALEQEKESVLDKIFPDNATNGDMIKTIFPNLEWRDERGDTKSYILEPEHILSPKLIAFNSWWDAPYKALEQEPKTGHWIEDVDKWGDIVTTVNGYKCSECGAFNADKDNYCPNCGAKMIEPQESEVAE